jgi:hypothetical protein
MLRITSSLYGSSGLSLVGVPSYLSIHTTARRWSYGINLTFIGNAVYTSMDVPDFFLAVVKVINYLHWEWTQNILFVIFIGVWT